MGAREETAMKILSIKLTTEWSARVDAHTEEGLKLLPVQIAVPPIKFIYVEGVRWDACEDGLFMPPTDELAQASPLS